MSTNITAAVLGDGSTDTGAVVIRNPSELLG